MYKCKYCGWIGLRNDFELDHPIPIARMTLAALLLPKDLICSGCNRQKGDKTPEEYIVWRLINPIYVNFGPLKS